MKYRITKIRYRALRHFLAAPIIWALIIPLATLDLLLEIYHQICFPLYNLPKVNRSEYIKIDHHKLKYLNWAEKINCVYCGYANGWLGYAAKIAGETEKYWCAIKHAKYAQFHEPSHHMNFLEYGDESGFEEKYHKHK